MIFNKGCKENQLKPLKWNNGTGQLFNNELFKTHKATKNINTITRSEKKQEIIEKVI